MRYGRRSSFLASAGSLAAALALCACDTPAPLVQPRPFALSRAHVDEASPGYDAKRDRFLPWAEDMSTLIVVCSGLVSVNGHGEAAVTVAFANLVATARVVSPFATPVPEKVFAGSPRLVAARGKLQPSDPDVCALFGKRTSLVLAIVATADRRAKFVDDIRHRYGGFYR